MNAYFPELMLILGATISAIVCLVISYLETASGTLQIDRTNPEKDIYRLSINDLDSIASKKHIWLAVDPNAHFEDQPRE